MEQAYIVQINKRANITIKRNKKKLTSLTLLLFLIGTLGRLEKEGGKKKRRKKRLFNRNKHKGWQNIQRVLRQKRVSYHPSLIAYQM